MREEVVLFVDELELLASRIPSCRICHEAEFESCMSLEAPCSCSGTVEFAHRDCIQRWCDEKGNTTCEICLQNFEPGYTAPVKKTQLVDAAVSIRRSLEVQRRESDLGNTELAEEQLLEENDYTECSSAADRSANCCRLMVLVMIAYYYVVIMTPTAITFLANDKFTVLLLVRHILAVLAGGTEDYPFTLLTLLVAKTSGIVIPMYILVRLIAAIRNSIQNSIRHPCEDPEDGGLSNLESGDEEDEEQQQHLHRVEIHSL